MFICFLNFINCFPPFSYFSIFLPVRRYRGLCGSLTGSARCSGSISLGLPWFAEGCPWAQPLVTIPILTEKQLEHFAHRFSGNLPALMIWVFIFFNSWATLCSLLGWQARHMTTSPWPRTPLPATTWSLEPPSMHGFNEASFGHFSGCHAPLFATCCTLDYLGRMLILQDFHWFSRIMNHQEY